MLRSARSVSAYIFRSNAHLNSRRNWKTAMASSQMQEEREKAFVRCHPDEDNIIISLKLAGKQKRLNRPKLEPLEKSLGRIKVGLLPKPDKKMKKKQIGGGTVENGAPSGLENVNVALFESPNVDGAPLEAVLTSEMAWTTAQLLVCGNETYDVVLNPPTIEKMTLLNRPLVGFPLMPVCSFTFTDEAACTWRWLRRPKGGEWECLKVFESIYTPQESDIGQQLRVECTPGAYCSSVEGEPQNKRRRIGETMAVESGRVEKGPAVLSGAGRHDVTHVPTSAPDVRVVTYNILADQYATMEKSTDELYGYLEPEFLDVEYRKQLVFSELEGFNADIICCQEVDTKVHNEYLQPLFAHRGFTGVYTNKANSAREGASTFIRDSRFEVVSTHNIIMKEVLSLPLPDSLEVFSPLLENSSHLREAIENVGTIAQICVLRPVDCTIDKPLIVANTHLFFHPLAGSIRMMQSYAIVDALHKLMTSKELCETLGSDKPAVLFCGDMNSNVGGVVDLVTKGKISFENYEWKEGSTFRWGKDENGEIPVPLSRSAISKLPSKGVGVDLQLPFSMESALDLKTPYTNYTIAYKGLLDYVFYREEDFFMKQVVPLPEECNLGKAIPSETFPSDHLSVVVDLTWRENPSIAPVPATLENAQKAASSLRDSGVIAVPTDTLYGLAADAHCDRAIRRIYSIKGRSFNVPLAICVGNASDVGRYCDVSHLPQGLLEALLPGPVTLVLNRLPNTPLSPNLNPGLQTVGVRIPDSTFIQSVCTAHGGALALTSANHSGQPSSLDVSDFRDLWCMCSSVYDGGLIQNSRSGSTVIELVQLNKARILREGSALDATLTILERFGIVSSS